MFSRESFVKTLKKSESTLPVMIQLTSRVNSHTFNFNGQVLVVSQQDKTPSIATVRNNTDNCVANSAFLGAFRKTAKSDC